MNLRVDPLEQHMDAPAYPLYAGEKLWTALPAAALVQQHAATFDDFPPRQRPPEFNPQKMLEQVLHAPLGVITAPANRHDYPLLRPTLDTLKDLGPLPDNTCVHLDAGYDSHVTRALLADYRLTGTIASKGIPAPVQATKRWPVERNGTICSCSEGMQGCVTGVHSGWCFRDSWACEERAGLLVADYLGLGKRIETGLFYPAR